MRMGWIRASSSVMSSRLRKSKVTAQIPSEYPSRFYVILKRLCGCKFLPLCLQSSATLELTVIFNHDKRAKVVFLYVRTEPLENSP